jgi:hypothetical protein
VTTPSSSLGLAKVCPGLSRAPTEIANPRTPGSAREGALSASPLSSARQAIGNDRRASLLLLLRLSLFYGVIKADWYYLLRPTEHKVYRRHLLTDLASHP